MGLISRTLTLPLLSVAISLATLALFALSYATAVLAREFGATRGNALAAGFAAPLVPSVVKLTSVPFTTDLFGAACAACALVAAFRRKRAIAVGLLVLAVCVRETNCLFALPIGAIALDDAHRRAATATALFGGLALVLPRFLLPVSAHQDVAWQMWQGVIAKRDWRAVSDYALAGFSLLSPLAVVGLRRMCRCWTRAGLGLAISGFIVTGLLSADAGRLVGSVSFLVIALGASVPIRLFPGLCAVSAATGVLWLLGAFATAPLVIGALASALTTVFFVRTQQTSPSALVT